MREPDQFWFEKTLERLGLPSTNFFHVPHTHDFAVIPSGAVDMTVRRDEACGALLNLNAGDTFLHGYYCQLRKGHEGMHRSAPLAQATDDAVVVLDWNSGTTPAPTPQKGEK